MIAVYDAAGNLRPQSKPKPPAHPCAEGTHCWHLAEMQHTAPNHSDWTCCHCGNGHCVFTSKTLSIEHGQYSPKHPGCGVILGAVILP